MTLKIGDVVQIQYSGWGFERDDVGKWVEILDNKHNYSGGQGYYIKGYENDLALCNAPHLSRWIVGEMSFGKRPVILLNTKEDYKELGNDENHIAVAHGSKELADSILGIDRYSTNHYDSYYHLTEQDIKEGKIRVDAYWVAKQWRTGSRDDSGALWHSLKTIARFGEKNSVEREIKALYNQAKALGRIYGVNLDE